jgi:hypothetical protein
MSCTFSKLIFVAGGVWNTLFYLMGHWGMRLKKFMCHGGKKNFFKMGGCRF